MYYRYEINIGGAWVGAFSSLPADKRRHLARFIKEPGWYSKNPGKHSECWFTELGYQKYHRIMENTIGEFLKSYGDLNLKIRVRQTDHIDNIVCRGKIQCIRLCN